MTVPGVAAGLLLAAGLALGILLALLVPRIRVPRRSRPAAPPPAELVDDDLPGFLAAPPGSDGRPTAPRPGWAVLSPVAEPLPVRPAPEQVRSGRPVLVAGTATLVLLAASFAVMATAGARRPAPVPGPDAARSPATSPSPSAAPLPTVPPAPSPGDPGAGSLAAVELPTVRDGIRADLTFAGIVLERRAVGVTAAYPHVRISAEGGTALAHVELVTFNCLADAAPSDPVAAGCSRVVPEYAELTSPALQVTKSGNGGLVVHGRFPTYVRPNGTPAAWTGEVYELRIEATPQAALGPGTDAPATGILTLGDDRAPTTPVSVERLDR